MGIRPSAPAPLDHGSLSGRAALTREPVHVPDVTVDPDYVYDGPVSFRANLSVPILLDGELIGVFGIVRREPEPFSDEVIDLVKTFADQAAIAIANARLIDAIEQQLEEQRAVSDTLRAVAEGGGLQPVLDAIVDAAKRLCHGEHAQLYLLEGDVLRIVSQTSDLHEAYDYAREHPHLLDRSTVVGRVALSREAEQITDVLEDPDYTYEGQKMIGFRALLGVPIAKEGELIGAIAVARDVPGTVRRRSRRAREDLRRRGGGRDRRRAADRRHRDTARAAACSRRHPRGRRSIGGPRAGLRRGRRRGDAALSRRLRRRLPQGR